MLTDLRFQEQEMETKLKAVQQLTEIEVGGETTIDDEVIAAIAGVAAKEVDGVSSLGASSFRRTLAERVGGREERARGVGVESGRREAILDFDMRVVYGFSIPQIVINVRQLVAHRVLELTALIAKEININVTAIDFPDRMPGKLE